LKIIGIVGTRKRDDKETFSLIEKKFLEIYEDGDRICSGGCPKGGDRCAEYLAKKYGVPILIFYPNKRKYGTPRAFFMRNTEVATKSDVILASVMNKDIDYIRNSKRGGTEDTIKKYWKLKKRMIYLV